MKKSKILWPLIVSVALSNLMVFADCKTTANVDPIDKEAVYIVDENFSSTFIKKDGKFRVSGWDIKNAGGTAAMMNPLILVDTSNKLPVVMSKTFTEQTKGIVTFETKLDMKSGMDGMKIELLRCKDTAISILYKDNKFYYGGETTDLPLKLDYNIVDYIYIKADLNLDNNTATVFINHAPVLENVPFKNPTGGINNIVLTTGAETTGSAEIAVIRIYKNFVQNEYFITNRVGELPYNFTGSGNNPQSASIQHLGGWSGTDGYALHLKDENPVSNCGVKSRINATSDEIAISYLMNYDDSKSGGGVKLYSQNQVIGQLVTKNGGLSWVDNNGLETQVYKNIYTNFWYEIKIKINQKTGKATVLLNFKEIGTNLSVGTSKITDVEYITSISGNKGIWVDNIEITPIIPLPADYVPEPVIPKKTDDRLVGLQSCSLWEEGEGHGWNFIDSVRDREPIIGYYDEGSPEVADWEIKWLLEHGVDFQMFCWFGNNQGNVGKAIKRPALEAGLHEGFMNAKYSDKFKFSIMLENQASHIGSSQDFRENNLRYWVEYYFKDPRYLVVDNKPVVAIYNFARFAEQVGGYENATADVEFIKQSCRDIGFDGAIVLSTSSSLDKSLGNLSNYGIDGIFSYNWGASSGYEDLQRWYLDSQIKAAPNVAIPNIAVGWNAIPWGGEPGISMTPEKFGNMLKYTKEKIVPQAGPTNLAKKMVFLANWNEFGEGTYIYPTKRDGFAYLDALRSAVTDNSPHKDAVPTQAQIDRVSRLYPKDIYVPLNTSIKPEPSKVAVKKWDFEKSLEGWASDGADMENVRVENGMMCANVVDRDPKFVLNKVGVDLGTVNYIKFTMKNNTESSSGRIYFTTDSDQTPNEAKGIRFYNKQNSDELQEIYVYTGYNKNWKGKLDMLRIDAVEEANGTVAIGDIELLRDIKQGVSTIKVNGDTVPFAVTPTEIDGTTMVDCETLCQALSATSEFDYSNAEANILLGDTTMNIAANRNTILVNDKEIKLNVAPITDGNLIMVPLRGFSEALGCLIEWNEAEKVINIVTNPNQPEIPKSVKSSEFNVNGKLDGWYPNEQLYLSNPAKGTVKGSILDANDPFLEWGFDKKIPCADVKEIKIRMKTSVPLGSCKMYFSTAEDPQLNENKTFTFELSADTSDYVEYTIKTADIGDWKGNLRHLRWDFEGKVPGDFEIDYIRLQ